MDDLRLRRAFARVKTDLDLISSRVDELGQIATLNEDIKTDIQKLRRFNIEKFVDDMEREFRTVEVLVDKFSMRFKETSNIMKALSSKIDGYHKEVDTFRKAQKNPSLSKKEVENIAEKKISSSMKKSLEPTMNEFAELMHEKISLEIGALKSEMTHEIAKVYDRCFNEIMDLKREVSEKKVSR